jgi:hypothetical protein
LWTWSIFVMRLAVFILASLAIYFVPAVAQRLLVSYQTTSRCFIFQKSFVAFPAWSCCMSFLMLFVQPVCKDTHRMACDDLFISQSSLHWRGMLNPPSRHNAFDYEGKEFASGGPSGKYWDVRKMCGSSHSVIILPSWIDILWYIMNYYYYYYILMNYNYNDNMMI